MRKSIIYVTSLIMLAVLPLSVIGVNLSIHLCKNKNKTFIDLSRSLFVSENKNSFECCNSEVKLQTQNKVVAECCEVQPPECSKCDSETDEHKNITTPGFIDIKCCFNQSNYFAVAGEFLLLNPFNLLNDGFSQFQSDQFSSIYESTQSFVAFNKKIQFPIKELILHIIKFIHTFTLSSEGGEEPYLI